MMNTNVNPQAAQIIQKNEREMDYWFKIGYDHPFSRAICFEHGDDCTPDTECPLRHLCGQGHSDEEKEALAKELITTGKFEL